MKTALLGLVALILVAGGVYYLTKDTTTETPSPDENVASVSSTDNETPLEQVTETPPITEEPQPEPITVLGTSVNGNDISAYHYGEGATELLFIGGIHGGYSWNTSLVAYELMDYLEENPDIIPDGVRVTVVPVLNPDGLEKVVGSAGRFEPSDVPASDAQTVPGRFNAHNVDLNRNFDCAWQETGVWQSRNVSGGSEPFSEPESQAIKNYIDAHPLAAVVVWYSAAGGVFSSNCYNGVLPETSAITKLYAKASGYPAYEEFDFYEVTGDMVNWLAKEGIPGISVLLTTHKDTEWSKNLAGIEVLLEYYGD